MNPLHRPRLGRLLSVGLFTAAGLVASQGALAQSFPSKPIRFIVASGAGSSSCFFRQRVGHSDFARGG